MSVLALFVPGHRERKSGRQGGKKEYQLW